MARLLLRNEWFEPLSLHAQYEAEFERILLAYAATLFPTWFLVSFKADVHSDEGVKRPDLALIDRDYRRWWVVETEMARHDFNSHVFPQARVLAQGRYDDTHVSALLRAAAHLDPARVGAMVRGEQPRVWVVVDHPRPDWRRPLEAIGVALGVVEIFRSATNQHVFRLNGEQPQPPTTDKIGCRRDPTLLRLWTVDTPALLPIGDGERMDIYLEGAGQRVSWMRRDTADAVYLSCTSGNPLRPYRRASLARLEDGRWFFTDCR
jgi:hypothetical protein